MSLGCQTNLSTNFPVEPYFFEWFLTAGFNQESVSHEKYIRIGSHHLTSALFTLKFSGINH
jgi:hypothetical protein